MDGLAVDILVGHSSELHTNRASGNIAQFGQPFGQPFGQNGLPGSIGAGRGPHNSFLALSQRTIFSGESFVPFLMLGLGILLVMVLIVVERRAVQPLLASFLYQSRAFVSSNITQFLVGVSLIIARVSVPLMAATVMEKGAWESALHLVRLTAAIPVGAVVGVYIMRWVGGEGGVYHRSCVHRSAGLLVMKRLGH